MEEESKVSTQEHLYSLCIEVFIKLEHKSATVNDIVTLLRAWCICTQSLRAFYNYIDTNATRHPILDKTPKEIIRTLCSYLANATYDMNDKELQPVSIRSISNVLKMYIFLTEKHLKQTTGNCLNNIGPAVAAQVYGDSTIVGNLSLKQMSEFLLPTFTIIN